MENERASIDEMARILRALQGAGSTHDDTIVESADPMIETAPYDEAFAGSGEAYDLDPAVYDPDVRIRPAVTTSSASVDAMKAILEGFHAAQDGNAAAPEHQTPEVREALATAPTPRGARIGAWEIVREAGNNPRYDVVNSSTGAPIAKQLYLYDAALGLVRCLNEGVSITDPRVRDLLALEADYARNANDAVSYRDRAKRLREKADDKRAAVAEDRLDEAERLAETARERILKLAGLR